MALANTTLVPELQYWFNRFVTNSIVNKNEVPLPVAVDQIFLPERSFIELLFNENYSYDSYEYRYKNETRTQYWPELTRNRLTIYPGSAKYLVLDETGGNPFQLQPHDFILLDALLAYRQDSTALTIVDSTSVEFVSDATANVYILKVNYSNLNTTLSKLIYLYLDLKIYSNYQNYNNLQLVSTGTLLETCFEFLLIDEYFAFMSARDVDIELVCT